ncbi:hypothetical protein [Deinococcus sonorensis]|uniref:Uncharacterized protein n=1 Tax=Deinococcus sonorensis TaxID=309891 RepID=A0ABV8YEI9_9DEIO
MNAHDRANTLQLQWLRDALFPPRRTARRWTAGRGLRWPPPPRS